MMPSLLLYHLAFLGILLLMVQSLTLAWRTGLFSLGHHGFFGLGAYAGAALMQLLLPDRMQWPLATAGDGVAGLGLLALSVFVGAVLAGSVAYFLSHLFAPIRGDYFAVATLVFAEIVRSTAANWKYLGGGLGFETPYLIIDKARNLLSYNAFYGTIITGLNIGLFFIVRQIDKSPYGLYINAAADDSVAAELSGVDVRGLQSFVLTMTAAIAGGAGVIFLHFTTLITPGDFSFTNSLLMILSVALGRLSSARCIMAGTFIYVLYEFIKAQFLGALGPKYGMLIGTWKEALLGVFLILSAIAPKIATRNFFTLKNCLARRIDR